MSSRDFLGLEETDDPLVWRLPLRRQLLTPGDFLFGGCGLAAAVEAMEGAAGRPLVWATAQYLGYAKMPATLDLEVTLAAQGRSVTQARCVVRDGEREILTAQAALGRRPEQADGQWALRPDAPPWQACQPRPLPGPFSDTIMGAMEMRTASGRPFDRMDGTLSPDGRSAVWIRLPGGRRLATSGDLAILGDHMPSGVGQALGRPAGGTSLDNTLRVVTHHETEWVLLDIRVSAIAHGFGHGLVHLWAEDGTLLATGSQSVVIRTWRPPGVEGLDP